MNSSATRVVNDIDDGTLMNVSTIYRKYNEHISGVPKIGQSNTSFGYVYSWGHLYSGY